MTGAGTPPLHGCHILVVEDEYLIADVMQVGLEEKGATVIGPAPSVRTALRLLEAEPRIDCAVLDINLGGEKVFPVADALQARHIPFLFTTGYNVTDIPDQWHHVRTLEKPIEIGTMTRALTACCAR